MMGAVRASRLGVRTAAKRGGEGEEVWGPSFLRASTDWVLKKVGSLWKDPGRDFTTSQ